MCCKAQVAFLTAGVSSIVSIYSFYLLTRHFDLFDRFCAILCL